MPSTKMPTVSVREWLGAAAGKDAITQTDDLDPPESLHPIPVNDASTQTGTPGCVVVGHYSVVGAQRRGTPT